MAVDTIPLDMRSTVGTWEVRGGERTQATRPSIDRGILYCIVLYNPGQARTEVEVVKLSRSRSRSRWWWW